MSTGMSGRPGHHPHADVAQALRQGQAEGWLPRIDLPDETPERPWPVVLLTALGAWLVVVPLIALVAALLGNLWRDGLLTLMIGLLMLAASVHQLRRATHRTFAEQVLVPCLVVGLGLCAYALEARLPLPGDLVLALLGGGALAVGAFLPQTWLRFLLGVLGAAAIGLAGPGQIDAVLERRSDGHLMSQWLWPHALLGAWGLVVWAQRRWPPSALGLEHMAAGWLVATLMALVWWGGRTFLLDGVLGVQRSASGWQGGTLWQGALLVQSLGSVLLALLAVAWLAHRWPSLRQVEWLAAALPLAGLALFMPNLGGMALAAALCATGQRHRLLAAALAGLVWIVGAFYYQLHWSLNTKAGVLLGAGALLAVVAALAQRGLRRAPVHAGSVAPLPLQSRAVAGGLLALSGLLALGLVNTGIWKKEQIIAQGRSVFVALAPVDPRSLMQGDYMALSFVSDPARLLPSPLANGQGRPATAHLSVVFALDARGVAQLRHLADGRPLASDELLVDLAWRGGRWVLATEAFFFKEGTARRWQGARYGEFRINARGEAVLVGLRGAELQAL